MNSSQCTDSLRTIVALFSMSAQAIADYVAAIMQVCAWMDGYRFDQVCKAILPEVGIQKPRPGEYLTAYRRLEDAGKWPKAEGSKCPICDGTGYSVVYVVPPDRLYGGERVMQAVSPCKCNNVQIATKPDTPGNPVLRHVPAPPGADNVERFLIEQQMRDPDYEAKVRAGWRKMGYPTSGDVSLPEAALDMLRCAPEVIRNFKFGKNVAQPAESESEFIARREREIRRLRESVEQQSVADRLGVKPMA